MESTTLMKLFLNLVDNGTHDRKQRIKSQERIIFATEGIIKPDNWAKLSLDEKEKRINKLMTI
jgi:2-polyprenyl-3-methyl-5-hydroxy-6-metoxy-1,4-benzoquinol methylase|tara:strand:+ start:154 stop:342 length:189 start_codon:yes stop_codon:yes gene_type:complete